MGFVLPARCTRLLAGLAARALSLSARLGRGFQEPQQKLVAAILAFIVIHDGRITWRRAKSHDGKTRETYRALSSMKPSAMSLPKLDFWQGHGTVYTRI